MHPRATRPPPRGAAASGRPHGTGRRRIQGNSQGSSRFVEKRGAFFNVLLESRPMPLATPFHARTSELCTSLLYKEWAGYYAVRSYDTCHSREYFAFRHAAGLLDVSPLFKYLVRGRDAAALLSRIWAK